MIQLLPYLPLLPLGLVLLGLLLVALSGVNMLETDQITERDVHVPMLNERWAEHREQIRRRDEREAA